MGSGAMERGSEASRPGAGLCHSAFSVPSRPALPLEALAAWPVLLWNVSLWDWLRAV